MAGRIWQTRLRLSLPQLKKQDVLIIDSASARYFALLIRREKYLPSQEITLGSKIQCELTVSFDNQRDHRIAALFLV